MQTGFRSGSLLQAGLLSSYSCNCFSAAPSLRGHYPLPRYYEPLRLPARAGPSVIDSLGPLGHPTLPGLPGSSTNLSLRAVPNHPGRPSGCSCSLLPHRYQASSSLADWPPPIASRGRIGFDNYGSQVCFPGFHRADCSAQLRFRYMYERAIYMMNTFQFHCCPKQRKQRGSGSETWAFCRVLGDLESLVCLFGLIPPVQDIAREQRGGFTSEFAHGPWAR